MLDLDPVTIFFEIVNFLILTVLLYRFLFQPVLRKVEARAAEKERLKQQITREHQVVVQTRADLERQLTQAHQQAGKIIMAAREQAEADRLQLVQTSQTEVEHILAQAHLDAQRVRQQAEIEFHEGLIQTILDTSRWVIGQTAGLNLHQVLVQDLYDWVWSLGQNGMQQVQTIRQTLQDRQPVVYISTAQPLTPEQQGQLASIFTALADREVELDIEVEPKLVAGLQVRIGDTMINNSIAGKLAGLGQEVSTIIKSGLPPEKWIETFDWDKELTPHDRIEI